MPIIKRRPKETLKPVLFRIPEELAARLTEYSEFVNVPQAEIAATALSHVIESDKDFVALRNSKPAIKSDSKAAGSAKAGAA
jgi:predicted DNA-binding protein